MTSSFVLYSDYSLFTIMNTLLYYYNILLWIHSIQTWCIWWFSVILMFSSQILSILGKISHPSFVSSNENPWSSCYTPLSSPGPFSWPCLQWVQVLCPSFSCYSVLSTPGPSSWQFSWWAQILGPFSSTLVAGSPWNNVQPSCSNRRPFSVLHCSSSWTVQGLKKFSSQVLVGYSYPVNWLDCCTSAWVILQSVINNL